MKISPSTLLSTAILLSSSIDSISAFSTTDLVGGGDLSVNITHPLDGNMIQHNDALQLTGTASIGKGHPDVAYIYVIDTSGSTDAYDGVCGTVLECVQEFFKDFHNASLVDGGAHLTAVVNFDDSVNNQGFIDPNNLDLLESTIEFGTSSGDTFCGPALEEAARLAEIAANRAETTIVVFAGDGQCHDYNVEYYANMLGDTGAIVHSVAVGDSVDCEISQNSQNDLSIIPQNGGSCSSIPDPHTLPTIIDDLIGTTLTELQVTLDGSEALQGIQNTTSLSHDLPLQGAATLEFDMELPFSILSPGSHQVCVQVTGNDTLGDSASVQDCVDFMVAEAPSGAPSVAPTMSPSAAPSASPSLSFPSAAPSKGPEEESPDPAVIAGAVLGAVVGLAFLGFGIRSLWIRQVSGKTAEGAKGELDLDENHAPMPAERPSAQIV